MAHQLILVLFVFTFFALFFNIDTRMLKSENLLRDLHVSDIYLTPLKIVRKNGYPGEAHMVKSKDGYILELHRIPHGKAGLGDKKRIPILIHHGLLSSSIDWIINGPDKSLGYRLADEGYDVWLANARGNTFSRSHIKYSPKQKEFWDYSFHEMGFYDLPASIDHILEMTGEKELIYIGHSLGTTVFFVMASTLPEYRKKIKFQISLAPVTAITHTTSAYRLLAPLAETFVNMIDWYNRGAFLENDIMTRTFTDIYYGDSEVIFSLFGKDQEQFNASLFPVISKHFPAGTSGKNLIHCSQLIDKAEFSQYDYEKNENIKRYGSAIPPKYDINKINVPIRLYYSENDLLANPIDTKLLYNKIPEPLGLKRVSFDKFNHVDFLWAKDINKLLNDEIIEFIKNSTDHQNGQDFIQNTITRAIEKRNNTSAQNDVPFDKKTFLNKVDSKIQRFTSLPPLLFPSIRQTTRKRFENIKNAMESDFKK